MPSTIHAPTKMEVPETAAPGVFRLIYRSRSKIADSSMDRELGVILRVARAANATKGITGALLLYDHWFAQVLEGDEQAVRKLFAVIKTDPRHDNVDLTQEGHVPTRAFGRWAMANVGEYGSPDIPLIATPTGTTEGESWRLGEAQEKVVSILRSLTRGYGIGS